MMELMVRRRHVPGRILGAGLAVLALLTSSGVLAQPKTTKDTVSIVMASPVNSFMQNIQTLNAVGAVAESVLEGLTQFQDENDELKLEPELATSWELVEPKKWRFHLREGVKFSNGTPFTSADVLASVKLLVEDKPGTFSTLFNKYKLEAPDDHTVDVTTEVENEFATPMRFSLLRVFPAALIKELGPEGVGTHPIGTGPYKVEDFQQGNSLTLVANENWWGPAPQIKKVLIRNVPDAATRISELQSGNVDLADFIPTPLADAIEADPRFRLVVAKTQSRRQLFFNIKSGVTANLKFRQAVNCAINREELVAAVQRAIPNGGIYSFTETAYDPAFQAYEYNPEKAKALLQEAGLVNPSVDLHVRSEMEPDKLGAQVIQAQLAAVGIDVHVVVGPGADSIPKFTAGELDGMYYGQFQSNYPTEDRLFSSHFAEKSSYGVVDGSRAATPIIEKLKSTSDLDERKALLLEVQKIVLNDEALWAPLYIEPDLHAVTANFHWRPRLGMKFNFEDAYFE